MSVAEPLEIGQHRMLDAAQCAELSRRVLGLSGDWVRRGLGFYSLGTAAYLDAPQSHAEYLERAHDTNPVLRANFADIHELVRTFFDERLAEPVRLTEDRAVPGFHVFEYDGSSCEFDRPATRAHFDLQWMIALPGRPPTATLSFTLAIEQPSGGAALEVWPLRYEEALSLGAPSADYADAHPSRRIAYTCGCMAVHDGHLLHAIGKSEIPNPVGRRITLQGHGALLDGVWVLYW